MCETLNVCGCHVFERGCYVFFGRGCVCVCIWPCFLFCAFYLFFFFSFFKDVCLSLKHLFTSLRPERVRGLRVCMHVYVDGTSALSFPVAH